MSTTLEHIARERLALAARGKLDRHLVETERLGGARVRRSGREYISFSCNDYFGLSHHPRVITAAADALQRYGAGAGASRLVTGNHPLYGALEQALAVYKQTEAALVFGSGYAASMGILPALLGKNDLILADRLSHACMLDGARLSGATLMRFAHNNLDHCRLLLEENRSEFERCLIMTETVFSMDGDVAPVAELRALAAAHDAWLLTDDAHGLGLLPPEQADLQLGTLSKALGSQGGYVCASRVVIDWLAGAARSLVFSTGLPPAAVAAAHTALQILREDETLAPQPLAHARQFTGALGLAEAQSAIVPILLGEPERALEAAAMFEREGYLVAAIRPPTVPPGTARLRFAFSAAHERADILRVAALLQEHGYA